MRALSVRLNGDAIKEVNERGERIVGDTLLLMLNAGDAAVTFVLPAIAAVERWDTLLETADPWHAARRLRAGDHYDLQGRSMAVMKLSNRKEHRRRTSDSDWPQS